ncbi:MAG: hypothetical protein AAF492_23375, partial [Verrucomicrobiota bacterium]
MDADYNDETGFSLEAFEMPCCGATIKLHALRYTAPCGFSKAWISFNVFTHIGLGWIHEYPWLGVVEARGH